MGSDYFAIVAGEKSGDLLGAGLIKALKRRYPDVAFVGIGGDAMIAAGCESMFPQERLAVMGFVEPLGRLPELFRIKRTLRNRFLQQPPLAFIGIDSPDFNLRLAAELHQQGVKTVHYVSPSVWAYRKGRIHGIKKAIDLMLTLFPFETKIYKEHGIAVSCVGHPLADEIGFEERRGEARQELGLAKEDSVVALMPGSRSGEIRRLAPDFLAAAIEALTHKPELKFLLPFSSASSKNQLQECMQELGLFVGEQFQLQDDSHRAMAAADVVLMASGTASLEAMLLRRPMIIAYKLAPLTYALASRIVKVPHMGLPNLLAGRRLVPEYLQSEVQPQTLCDELLSLLESEASKSMLQEFERVHRLLRRDASATAAATVAAFIEGELSNYLHSQIGP